MSGFFIAGSAGADTITTTYNSNFGLLATAFNDSLSGSNGDDSLDGGAGNDIIGGGLDNDILVGGEGNDSLLGNDGNDTVLGGAGADTMSGGVGRDLLSYRDDTSGVTANLLGMVLSGGLAQGDVVAFGAVAAGDFEFDGVEGGSGADNLRGNGFDNVLIGNGGADTIEGSLGADSIVGGDGNDSLTGDNALFDKSLHGADTLAGGDGADTLQGDGGADLLLGGTGSDRYWVDNAGDTASEADGGGLDTIYATVNWTLGDGFESLVLAGARDLTGTGNALDNRLTGNRGDNVLLGGDGRDALFGGDGADTLNGGAGPDKLVGGAGNDVFVLSNPGDRPDRITDFNATQDSITIAGSGFGIPPGVVPILTVGSVAIGPTPQLVYDPLAGLLFWDVDGDGPTRQVLLALIDQVL